MNRAMPPNQPARAPKAARYFQVIAFLVVLAAIPTAQIVLELSRGERVHMTDLFRYAPTEQNLRQYETTLEDCSWFQQFFRPRVQRFLFEALGDAGSKAVLGRDGWLFYRPDLRILIDPDRPEPGDVHSVWVEPWDGSTVHGSARKAIVRFNEQLKERGIRLLVVPVPGKSSVYPDKLSRRAAHRAGELRSPAERLLAELEAAGVECVDLFAVYREARRSPAEALYLSRDTHWTPLGAQVAARATASKIRDLGWTPPESRSHRIEHVRVERMGDIVEMMQIPGLAQSFPAEPVSCEQVIDTKTGLMVPSESERPGTYRDPGREASVLLLGDSFSRIYQMPEPQSLGKFAAAPARAERGTKRLLPGSAGFLAHVARALASPLDAIVSDGGASSDVRKKLAAYPEILEGKSLVIWEFAERDIALGAAGWEDIPLPPPLGR
jgi:hypothetical protein